ncbi:MAG: hypothetical protein ACKVZ0_18990 [Gemmatimonadales bacterium]
MSAFLSAAAVPGMVAQSSPRFLVSFPAARTATPQDGRVILLISSDSTAEPRFQMADGLTTQLAFGIDVDQLAPGRAAVVDARAWGFPIRSIKEIPAGRYRVQALLNRYQTFRRADGHTVKLPPDRGEGQQWNSKPGNFYSTPRWITFDPKRPTAIVISLDQEIPPARPPVETKYIKYERIQSKLLTDFWGTPTELAAWVLLPEGFDTHPNARYPLVINHGHFPAEFGGFRPEPPDPNLKPDFSARFNLAGYNRIQQELAHQFYRDWTGPNFPRVLLIEIQHPTPFYDDSYAVNSANNGPYGDAIMKELVPHIERKYRGIGQGYARITYGGSTGGWEAMAVQMFYPDEFNGAFVACPDPIDFRQYTNFNLYEEANAYWPASRWKKTLRPGHRNYLGQVDATVQDANYHELAIATKGRSGGQWDIWQAVYSPVGPDGYPKPIWDKVTGVIDKSVAEYWRENFDLSHILRRDWKALGPKLRGKLHIYVGEMDNFYLNNAVYLVEDFLKTADPPADAIVDYGARDEHCWNGDHTRSNAYSRLRYHQMFIPRIIEQIRKNGPPNADTVSWRY